MTKISEIASNYHDREVMTSRHDYDSECPCCGQMVSDLTSVEHDSCDYSKDLWVCGDCYFDIYKWWRSNKPKKICPV